MDTPEIDEGQEIEQVSLQDDIQSAFEETETVAETTEETVEEVLEALQAPNMWGKEYKDVFDSWGELDKGREYQQSMIDLYGTTQAHVTKTEQESAGYKTQADSWNEIFQPYQQQMNLQGTDGPAFMRQLLGYYQQLNSNPSGTIQQLAQNYNLDLSKIGQDAPYQSPTEQMQARRIDQLERAFQGNQEQARNGALNQINQQIETFASEQDASGNLMRPHFDQVKDTMTQLISGGAAPDLNQAYDMACKLSPDLAAQVKAQEVAADTARKAADAKKAKAASARPTGKHKGGKVQNTLKEDIQAAFDEQAA